MDDKNILLLLFKQNQLRLLLRNYVDYLCKSDCAQSLLHTSIKYTFDINNQTKFLNTTFDDLDVIFNEEFTKDSEELELWNNIKAMNISDVELIKHSITKNITRILKEYFFAKVFTTDSYNLDLLEELYVLLSDVYKIINNEFVDEDKDVEEHLNLNEINDYNDVSNSEKVEGIKFFDNRVSDTLSTKQFDVGTLNVITGAPGRGKTQLILNQVIYSASLGKKTLHIAIGDLTKKQLIFRILAIITKISIQQISMLSKEQFNIFLNKTKNENKEIFDNLTLSLLLPNKHSCVDIVREIEKSQKNKNIKYDQITIDYDGNIETDISSNYKQSNDKNKSMYYAGADIYNTFVTLAKRNKSVVFMLSQPKPQFWSTEKIPIEALNDSSKKGHIIDFCMSIAKKDVLEDVATLYISKNRHGESFKTFKLKQIGNNQTFEPINNVWGKE